MARFNKIYAGPFTEAMPQVREALASVAILPGQLISLNAQGQFALAAAGGAAKVYVAQDNYLTMKGVDTAYTVGETTIGMEMLDEQFFNVRFPTGVNVAQDAAITVGASGKGALAAAGNVVIGYAEEAYNNTTGADQLVRVRAAKGRTVPAA